MSFKKLFLLIPMGFAISAQANLPQIPAGNYTNSSCRITVEEGRDNQVMIEFKQTQNSGGLQRDSVVFSPESGDVSNMSLCTDSGVNYPVNVSSSDEGDSIRYTLHCGGFFKAIDTTITLTVSKADSSLLALKDEDHEASVGFIPQPKTLVTSVDCTGLTRQ